MNDARYSIRKWATTFIVMVVLLTSVMPSTGGSALAADEVSESLFTIVAAEGSQTDPSSFGADQLALLDAAVAEHRGFLGISEATQPIEIRLFDTTAGFEESVTEEMPLTDAGVTALAGPVARTIGIDFIRWQRQTELERANALRHALAHIMVSDATAGKIPLGFAEGYAIYSERPNPPINARQSFQVQTAYDQDKLISWFNVNRSDTSNDPELVNAESFAIVGFLIRQYGLPEFQAFMANLQTAESWRDAIKEAYEPSTSDSLERQWREKLPLWFAGDWKWNLISGFDFSAATEFLANGNFAAAENALLVSEQLLRDVEDPELLGQLEELQAQARAGGLAEEKMKETQQALENFAYERADAALNQAVAQYESLPPKVRNDTIITQYRALIDAGLSAESELESARNLSGNWGDYPEARSAAVEAGNGYAQLGDETMHAEATTLVQQLDLQRRRLVLLFGALALLAAVWLFVWLRARGRSELEWS